MNDLIEHFETALIAANSASQCDTALHDFLEKKGITTFSFTYYAYNPCAINRLKYDTCSANFKTWHQHYLEENYNNIDNTLRFVYNNQLPVYWNLKQQLAQATSDTERQMRLDSIAFGAECGLSIPIHGAHNNFAILLLVQMQGQRCGLEKASNHYEFLVVGQLYYHYLQSHLLNQVSEQKSYQLTTREIQCLLLIARDHSVKEMAQTLELTERTVNFHIQKLNKKLGVKNKYQALSKALSLQLLPL